LAVLKKVVTPKRAVVAVAVAATFAAGWTVNGWRYQRQIAKNEIRLIEDYAKQRELYVQQFREQQITDSAALQRLTEDLSTLRSQRRTMQNKLHSAAVVKAHDEICPEDSSTCLLYTSPSPRD